MTKDPHKNLFIVLFLNRIVPLSAGLKAYLMAHIKNRVFEKGDYICHQGEMVKNLYVIKIGMVRGFYVSDGQEITTWISFDNQIFTSISGFFRGQEAQENIQALEKTQCVYMEHDDMHYCLRNFPEMKDLNRLLMEEYYIEAENRAFMARIPNAISRWQYFLKTNNKEIILRVPKKILASFLGMRPETLSRILKQHTAINK